MNASEITADHEHSLKQAAARGEICSSCRWWETPTAMRGLHECFNPAHVALGTIATFRHEACDNWKGEPA